MEKPTAKELAKLRAEYLIKREEILRKRVNSLQVQLFDKVFERYLLGLQDKDGKLLNSLENRNMIAGLNKIYENFNTQDNVPVIKTFFGELSELNGMNKSYFETIDKPKARTTAPIVKKVVDTQLGFKEDGSLKKGGFADKFIRDETVIKRIKKMTSQAISKGQDFTAFKKELKEYVTGNPLVKDSGGLQQYYHNYAYDTYQKVDRLNQQEFGTKLGLKYFLYEGGLIGTSRNFCIHHNGKIYDSQEFSKLTYSSLPESQRGGIPKSGWNPMLDLGGYGCRHNVNWVADSFAERNKQKYNERAKKYAERFKQKDG